ncbi:hypothetical protein Tco_0558044 [Tanacetum coccineum]
MQPQESKVDTGKAVEQTQQCKMKAAGQGMIQMLMMQISDPYMTKSQWLRHRDKTTERTFENAFNSEFKERMQTYTRFDAQSFKDAMIYSTVQDESSRSGNDTNADDANIRPIYDEEPMAETIEQTTSLLANNADLKAQIQEKVFAIAV